MKEKLVSPLKDHVLCSRKVREALLEKYYIVRLIQVSYYASNALKLWLLE